MEAPETRYARADDGVRIAYQRFGEGSGDLVYMPYFLFNVDLFWDFEPIAAWLQGLGRFTRVIVHDPRGTGLSDRDAAPGDLERRMNDLIAVLDDANVDRACIFGSRTVGALGALMGVVHPERTASVIWWHARASETWAPDYPWGSRPDELEALIRDSEARWGSAENGRAHATAQGPMGQVDSAFQRWMGKMYRNSVSPRRAAALARAWLATDVRRILSTLTVPTLVLARESTAEESAAVATMIPGARFVQLPGQNHMPWFDDMASVLGAVRTFVGADGRTHAPERFVATLLFTDIVGSTMRAAALGDGPWAVLVAEHNRLVRGLLDRYDGRELDTAGDGFFASFEAPGNAVRCALDAVRAAQAIGVEIRAGVHAGEVQRAEGKLGGLAVAIGARICSAAGTSEVLASSTVKDLTAGSGLVFDDAGEHELKGVPDRWRLYRVTGATPAG